MMFFSTRDSEKKLFKASEVIKNGLAADGGLFVPESIPSVSLDDISNIAKMSYAERAATVLSMYLSDYTYEELLEDATNAYCEASFPEGAAPLKKVKDNTYSLELWKGPTAAFKDMALQIMPRLLSRALVKTGEKNTALILVATSGDTGKAALEGHKDVNGVKIMVFYPVDGVSKVQKLQMATQTGSNVNVCAIKGNFDDAQTGVKKIFSNAEARARLLEGSYILSSANSINWGRLAPQIVYYFSAYCDLLNQGEIKLGDKINVCVPTGNFGNIFAAYLAKCMGLPIDKMVCASNANNILTDFINTGVYDKNRDFHLTMSPSMDILISSNLERLIFELSDRDASLTKKRMEELKEKGEYSLTEKELEKVEEEYFADFADEEECKDTIADIYDEYGYVLDPHTAVAVKVKKTFDSYESSENATVVLSTASPYKFPENVLLSINGKKCSDAFASAEKLSLETAMPIPEKITELKTKEKRFNLVIKKEEAEKTVLDFINK